MTSAGATNTVAIPLSIRIGAYLTTMLPLDAGLTWTIAEKHIDQPTALLLGALLSSLHGIAGMLALAHLTLPGGDDSSTPIDSLDTAFVSDAIPDPGVEPVAPVADGSAA